MDKFTKKEKDYINSYRRELLETDIPGKNKYLKVLDSSEAMSLNGDEFFELLSYGNDLVSMNVENKRLGYREIETMLSAHLHEIRSDEEIIDIEEDDPYAIVEKKDLTEAVFEAYDKLSPKKKTCIERLVLYPESITKLEKEMHMDHGTIRKYENSGIFEIAMSPRVAYYRFADDEFMTRLVAEKEERDSKSKNIKRR